MRTGRPKIYNDLKYTSVGLEETKLRELKDMCSHSSLTVGHVLRSLVDLYINAAKYNKDFKYDIKKNCWIEFED